MLSRAVLIVPCFGHPALAGWRRVKACLAIYVRKVPCTYNDSIRLFSRESPISFLLKIHRPFLRRYLFCGAKAGGSSDEDPPVPISNTEVKLVSSDGTWTQPGPGRVARCRTRKAQHFAGLLCYLGLDKAGLFLLNNNLLPLTKDVPVDKKLNIIVFCSACNRSL